MTVRVQELTVRRYTGLSTDEKPITNDSAPGSIFTETDTGDEYIYNGMYWRLTESPLGMVTLLNDIKDALEAHKTILEEIRDNQ